MQDIPTSIWLFFGMVVVISLSGVMMPGPLFAATIVKGYNDKRAGVKIALGHGLVEFPLMALIVLSADEFFTDSRVKLAIGLVGGTLMLFFGIRMIQSRMDTSEAGNTHLPYSSVVTGALTTAANPYFLLWWATVGLVLISGALEFGVVVVLIFAVVHWSCDLAWYSFTAFAVFKSKHLWTPRVHQIVFVGCGVLMMAFGAYFLVFPTLEFVNQ